MGIEPTLPAWKAGTLPLSYTRTHLRWWREQDSNLRTRTRTDLQSAAFDRSAIPPAKSALSQQNVKSILLLVLSKISFSKFDIT